MIERNYPDVNLVDFADRALARTVSVADEGLVAANFEVWIGAGTDLRTPATGFTDPYPYVIFPAAVGIGNKLAHSLPISPVWRRGQVRASVYWMPSSSAAGSVQWRFNAASDPKGAVAGAAVVMAAVSAGAPGTTDSITITPFADWLPIKAGDRIMAFELYRGAGDTYAGDARFLGLLLQFFPAKGSN